MAAPLLFMLIPILTAALVWGLRRWPTGAVAVAVGVGAVLAVLAIGLPVDAPTGFSLRGTWTVLGRNFVLEPTDRLGLAFILAQATLLFGISRLTSTTRWFLPMGWAILSLLAAALMIRPFVFSALFMELASALAVFLLVDQAHPATRGAIRFLAFMTVGMACILVTGWLLEAIVASPDDAALTRLATVMLALGFAVWLGVAPFHSWLPVVAEDSPALSTAFVFTVMRFPAAVLLLQFLSSYEWLNQNPLVYRALTLVGGGLVLLGALFVYSQQRLGRVLGYAMLMDVGAFLLAVGLNSEAGTAAALVVLVMRGLALTLWAPGMEQLRRAAPAASEFGHMRGLARRYPFATAAVFMGLLSLVGFPLTAGFPARWALLSLLAQIHPTSAVFLLVGMASVGLASARALAALLTPVEAEAAAEPIPLLQRLLAEPRASIAVLGAGLVAMLLLGAFPQWLLPAVAEAARLLITAAP